MLTLQAPADPPNPSDPPLYPPEFVDLFAGWDFEGMTDDQIAGFQGILHPLSSEQIEAAMTPEERERRALAILAFEDPEEYERRFPQQKSPEELAEEEFHRFAITNPWAYGELVQQTQTPEERSHDEFALWIILNPVESTQLFEENATPEERDARSAALEEAANPRVQPRPILVRVPYADAAIRYQELMEGRSQP